MDARLEILGGLARDLTLVKISKGWTILSRICNAAGVDWVFYRLVFSPRFLSLTEVGDPFAWGEVYYLMHLGGYIPWPKARRTICTLTVQHWQLSKT